MKVTEKTRNEIALSLGTLSIKDAEQIAAKTGKSMETVYRLLKILRTKGATIDPEDEVMLSLIELAASRKPIKNAKAERFEKSMKQLSAKASKQAA
jgi:hypothetical protein